MKDENFFRNQSDIRATEETKLEILKEFDQNETCFADDDDEGAQSQEIALIFTLATSLLGVFILIFGFVRDYICYGIARFIMFFILRRRFVSENDLCVLDSRADPIRPSGHSDPRKV